MDQPPVCEVPAILRRAVCTTPEAVEENHFVVFGEGGRQVFCVTHLPQLAGCGDMHLRVRKSVSEGRTRTVVEPLEGEARVSELAQMLGGDSEATIKIARELLAQKS